jgi:hypothetical protein
MDQSTSIKMPTAESEQTTNREQKKQKLDSCQMTPLLVFCKMTDSLFDE